MRKITEFFVVLLCYVAEVTASYCYPDYCQNLTILVPTPGFQCLLTRVQRGEECVKHQFEVSHREPSTENRAKFVLHAYVHDFKEFQTKATAFNLSITDANFNRLVTRYQNLLEETECACRHVMLYGNKTHPKPTHLYVSCPFSSDSYESYPYRLEYLVTGDTYEYSKQYIFNVPSHKYFESDVSIDKYTPFVYVDVSNAPILSLHVQPMPEVYNVTKYKIWLINNGTDTVTYTDTFSVTSKQDIWYNFTAHSGVYYFRVTAIHSDCGKYGCANSSTPYIIIRETSHRLLIMIISTVWIPPVILYALYHLYKLYRKEVLKRRKKPNCLLVYSPTRLSHINVMIDLAKYLRACNVNAMIDMLDVADTTGKDTDIWCTAAFQNADVILVATSPPSKEAAVSVIYRNTYNPLLRLLKENYPQREKRYFIVQFPYCRPEDVPEETQHFKRFCLPKELSKLVKTIYNVEQVRCIPVSDKEFLDSVKLAKLELLEEDSAAKETEETDGLLAPRNQKPNSQLDKAQDDAIPQSFATNIDELNLLGESREAETYYKPTTSAVEFRIDELIL